MGERLPPLKWLVTVEGHRRRWQVMPDDRKIWLLVVDQARRLPTTPTLVGDGRDWAVAGSRLGQLVANGGLGWVVVDNP